MYSFYDEQKKQLDDKHQRLEFGAKLLVAGECLRRDWPASLVCDSVGRFALTINNRHMPVYFSRGDDFANEGLPDSLLIFVNMPRSLSEPPEYFIAYHQEIIEATQGRYTLVSPGLFVSRNKSGPKVRRPPQNILIDELRPYQNRWDKVAKELGLPKTDWDTPRPGRPDPIGSE